jgi:hypothetical protein
MAFPPEAYIIGAQKAATTSLADLLGQHPGIVLSNPKEPNFYNVHWEEGLEWYRARYARTDALLLDGSVGYSMAPAKDWDQGREFDVPRRIHELSPNARFIYVVRDPAARCYSAYWHEIRAGREKRSLRKAVEDKAYYTMASYYFLQINRFLRFFPLERFLIVGFDRVTADSPRVAQQCAKFLNAGEPDFEFVKRRPKNTGFQYNRVGEMLRPFEKLSAYLPDGLKTYARKMVSKDVPSMSADDYLWMRERFRDDTVAFEKLTGIKVPSESSSVPGC